jgi:beta-N-acetylhexosaminidase
VRWLRRIGLVAAFVLFVAVLAGWEGFRGDHEEDAGAPATSTTEAPGRVAAPVAGATVDPRVACARELPPRQQLGQLLAIAVDGQAPDLEAQRVADLGIGTVLLQSLSPDQPIQRIQALKDASAIPPLVAVDEEGGAVQDLRDVLGPFPSEARMASTTDPAGAHDQVLSHAQSMATLGIDVAFAPVVDVLPGDGRDPLGDDRTFGSDPNFVTQYGQAYVGAFDEAGILPTLKHFPGHGNTTGDSHNGVVSAPPLPQLRERDLVPYDTLLDEDVAVMVGHMIVPDVTIFGPSSLSSGIIQDLLRVEYGFDGLIFTDSLSMGGVTGQGPPEELAFQALAAGADVALFATLPNPGPVLDRLVRGLEAGDLDPDQIATSVVRVLDVKGIDPCALDS